MKGTPKNKVKFNNKLIALIVVAVIAALAVVIAAFVLSFDALQAVAEGAKVANTIAGLMPLAVDGAITVGTMSALVLKALRQSTAYAWFVVLAGAAVSVGCNVLHAVSSKTAVVNGAVTHIVELTDTQSGFVAAIPAVALPISFHLLLRLIEAVIDATRTDDTEPVPTTRTAPVKKPRTASSEPVRTDSQTRTADPYGARTEAPRTDSLPRTDQGLVVPQPRTVELVEPSRTEPATETETVDKPVKEASAPVVEMDRDQFVMALASDMLIQGADWKPNYDELMATTGRKRSWCEKVVKDARMAATDSEDEPRTTDAVRTEQ